MRVLIIDGSPRINGNTDIILNEMINVFKNENVDVDVVKVGNLDIRGCMACGYCHTHDGCVFKDAVNETAKKLDEVDGIVVASPVYYASPNGTLISFLDRLFYSQKNDLRMKVGAALTVARRSGTTASLDLLNKYFLINQMPIASGRYWNNGYGQAKGEICEDKEGLQNARILARNMIFLMKSIALGKENFGLPEEENIEYTNFIKR